MELSLYAAVLALGGAELYEVVAENPIIYVLIAWVALLGAAKLLRLEGHGFELKAYSLVYKNHGVQEYLVRMLGRTRRGVRIFADVSVVSGFAMMGFAFWFLIDNIVKFLVVPAEAAELTVLIPGVTLTSGPAILGFLLSLPIVLVMHEGAHGIVAALEKIKIKSGGFAVFIAVFAGFVEPDEEEFEKAKKVSKMRVIGAGATANVIFALALGLLLLTNPVFAIIVPEPLRSAFYEVPEGVTVLSVMEGFGAERAGLAEGDVITSLGGTRVVSAIDLERAGLEPGQTVQVSVLRGGQTQEFAVQIMPSPDDPERGLLGIIRDAASFVPVYGFIEWHPQVSMYLLWLWMISFFIGIINMLPLPILDGGKFVHIIISGKMRESRVNAAMWGIYSFTFAVFALNIGLSYLKSGWFTI